MFSIVLSTLKIFQSTRSAWSATGVHDLQISGIIFQSTRSAWSATALHNSAIFQNTISIHALRMERDHHPQKKDYNHLISIHALRMERDLFMPERSADKRIISIHALRMERDVNGQSTAYPCTISIHALRMERDLSRIFLRVILQAFQSTRSAWSATIFLPAPS